MVEKISIIVVEKFKTSSETKVQLFLGEHILEALMIYEHINMNAIKVMCSII